MALQPVTQSIYAWLGNARNAFSGIFVSSWFMANLWWIALLVLLLVFAIAYILISGKKKPIKSEIDNSEIENLIQVLGGIDNIEEISLEGSRLKALLKNLKKCEYKSLKEHGASGIFVSGKQIKFILPKSANQLINIIQAKKKERIE